MGIRFDGFPDTFNSINYFNRIKKEIQSEFVFVNYLECAKVKVTSEC